jgi:succinoglycan biosynthesis transport protein ExoP
MSNESLTINQRADADRGDELDLPGLWQTVVSKKWLILGATIAAFLIALTALLIIKPRYTGEAKVLLENQESYFTRPDRAAEPTQSPDDAMVTSAVQLVTSRDLAREAIKALDLRGNREFDPLADGGSLAARVMIMLGLKRAPGDQAPEDRIFETYFDRLTVFNVTKSRVLQIEFASNDPDLAARGANTIASLYIDVQSRAKKQSAKVAATSLANLLGDLRGKLADAEARAEKARLESGLLMGANNATISGQQLADINTQITVARTAQADANAKARLLREAIRNGRLDSVSEVANNDLVRRLSEQRATLRGQIALESRTLLAGHPRIKELNAQLADLESELRSAADRAARQLDNDALVAKARVENLQVALDQQKKTVGGNSSDEVRQRELDREVKQFRDQVEAAMAKYQDAVARQEAESTPGDARIISRAVAPQLPSFPKKVPILIFATLAGFVLTLGWVVGAELLTGRAFVPPGTAAAYAAPRNEVGVEAAPLVAAHAAEPNAMRRRPVATERGLVDSLSQIAAQIGAAEPGDYALRVLLTADEGGVTSSALTLSRALAQSRRVILLDLDGTDVSRNGFGAVQDAAGLGELVAGEASFSEVIHRDRLSRLHLVPRGHGEAPAGEDLDLTIDALSQTYDFVVFAAPPAKADETAIALAPSADYAIILTSAVETSRPIAELRTSFVQAGAGEVLIASAASGGGGPRRKSAA